MIPNQKILEIQQLFAEGIHSNGEIALRVGVSRGTVGNVIKGKRMLMAVEPEPKPEKPDVYTRCPKCGARVLEPCITNKDFSFVNERVPRIFCKILQKSPHNWSFYDV